MREELLQLKSKYIEDIDSGQSLKELEILRVEIFGKKGALTKVLRGMGKLSKEERPIIGKLANEVREELENVFNNRLEEIKKEALEKKIQEETIDITVKKDRIEMGRRHPLNRTMEDLEDLFQTMGFNIEEGPEIETVANNFDLLNSPLNHPSRDKTDTFYITEDILLRTHTSPVQIRTMKNQKPPIRMVSAGRTFRFDDVDDTHSPMFHQIEGLVVDKNVTMANLIETINVFIREFFGEHIKTRYRPHYFPFTEPSIEVDVTCFDCGGEGCPVCSFTGWSMELLGGGMVHPKVFENCGIDSSIYSGFAFGMGVDRIAMVRYGIDNIRLLYENDARFLEQF